MTKEDFIKHCKELNHDLLCRVLSYSPEFLFDCPSDILTEDLLCNVISNNSSAFRFVPKDLKTERVCKFACSVDIQLIRQIPTRFITEPMMYKAVCLNADLFRGTEKDEFVSPRVVNAVIQAGSEYYPSLPDSLITDTLIVRCFELHGRFPEGLDRSVSHFARLISSIISNSSPYAGDGRYSDKLLKFKREISARMQSCGDAKTAIDYIADDWNPVLPRAYVFIGLGLHNIDKALKIMEQEKSIAPIILEFYQGREAELAEKATPLTKRRIIEESLGL